MPHETLGEHYMPTSDAAAVYKRSRDYIARLARGGEVQARRTGKLWEVEVHSLVAYIEAQEIARKQRAEELIHIRKAEYAKAQGLPVPRKPRARKSAAPKVRAQVLRRPVEPQVAQEQDREPVMARSEGQQVRESRFMEPVVAPAVQAVVHAASHAAPQATAEAMHMPTMLWKAVEKGKAHGMMHVASSAYSMAPALDVVHRAAALVTAVVLVFGAYAVANPVFAAYAYESLRANSEVLAVATYHGVNTVVEAGVVAANVSNDILLEPALVIDMTRTVANDIQYLGDQTALYASAQAAIPVQAHAPQAPDGAVVQFHAELERGMQVVVNLIADSFGLSGGSVR